MPPRFRIPFNKKPLTESIPIREKPMFNHRVPTTQLPPVPKEPTTSPDYDRAVQRLQRSIRPAPRAQFVDPKSVNLHSPAPQSFRPVAPVQPHMSADYERALRTLERTVRKTAPQPRYHAPPAQKTYGADGIVLPPRPVDYTPDISPRDVGPVGRPAFISLADIGPVGPQPDLPDWVIEKSKVKAPVINHPQLPMDIQEEGRFGVKVAPQESDYVAPPVTTPREMVTMHDVDPGPSQDEIYFGVQGQVQANQDRRPVGIPDRVLESRDFNLHDLLKGTSRHGGIGVTQGRTIGEGI